VLVRTEVAVAWPTYSCFLHTDFYITPTCNKVDSFHVSGKVAMSMGLILEARPTLSRIVLGLEVASILKLSEIFLG
jgi:hypothetical protein